MDDDTENRREEEYRVRVGEMRWATGSLLWRLLPLIAAASATIFGAEAAAPPSECLAQTCGAISNISYPFTLTRNNASCPGHPSLHSYFQLFCNETTQSLYMLPDAVYPNSSLIPLHVTSILNDSLIVNFSEYAARMTPSADGNFSNCSSPSSTRNVILPPVGTGPYVLSDDNDFGSFGCTTGYLYTANIKTRDNDSVNLYYGDHVSVGGCVVLLPDDQRNEKCDNGTCCIDSLPPASDVPTRFAQIWVDYTGFSYNQTDPICSCDMNYATIFHPNYTDFAAQFFGVKVKWALPAAPQYFNDTPQFLNDTALFTNLVRNSPDYACHSNASAVPVEEIQGGYLCSCVPGFYGDGYANGTGCSNVDECANATLNRCIAGSSKCRDTVGNYTCECNSRYRVGDGRSDGTGCKLSPSIVKVIISVSSIMGFLLIITSIIIFLAIWTKRMKRRNFMLNGGLELQEYMKKANHNTTRIFTKDELRVATNNYADDMKIGTGGFGTVYKGKLKDGKLVAIKKSIKLESGDNGQLFNEITILTKLNHKHIVRLLGCCLESRAPLLVYEFVPNGTLAENLEREDGAIMTWEQRLKVAIQTSEALTFLHRAASPPILHRDVKSANVLLDENWEVKVADFGVSRLVPDGVEHVSTAVQGTLGYLDPEYFQTLQLTDKSDVYSFGVLLVELITTLKPVDSRHREPQFSNLALLFIHHIKEGRIEEIIDPRLEIVDDQNSRDDDWAWKVRSSIVSVASLAHRCLALMGHDRPTMIEVEHELHRISHLLYATDAGMVEQQSLLLAGAVTIENDNYIVQSSGSYSNASIAQDNKFHVSTLGR